MKSKLQTKAEKGHVLRHPCGSTATRRDVDLVQVLVWGSSDGIDRNYTFTNEEAEQSAWRVNRHMLMSLRDYPDDFVGWPSGNRPLAWWKFERKAEPPHGKHVGFMDLAEFEYLKPEIPLIYNEV